MLLYLQVSYYISLTCAIKFDRPLAQRVSKKTKVCVLTISEMHVGNGVLNSPPIEYRENSQKALLL